MADSGTVGRKELAHEMAESLPARAHRPTTVAGFVVSAALVAASGGIHLYLWYLAYQGVATIGPLFLVQFSVAVVTALLLALWRKGVFLVLGFGLMIGTVIGFCLALSTGLFGFKLTFWSGWAYFAIIDELVAAIVLGQLRLSFGATAAPCLQRPPNRTTANLHEPSWLLRVIDPINGK
jgi:hypothetical protein